MSKKTVIIIAIIVLILAGAGTFTYFYFKNREVKAVPSPSPTLTLKISPSPVAITSPTPKPTPSPSSSPETTKIKIFMIAPDDNGASGIKVGCGDSAVAALREVPQTQAVLKAAMEELLSIKDKNYGQSGLYNSLYRYNLKVESVSIDDSGKAIIKLSGDFILVGTCEDPRIEAQLKETALQFSTVKSVTIYINDKTLDELMSQEG